MNAVVFPIFRVIGLVRPAYVKGRPERAGEVLAQLATGDITPPDGHLYASLVRGEVTYPEPAPLARDDEIRDDLWRRSASMVGLAP